MHIGSIYWLYKREGGKKILNRNTYMRGLLFASFGCIGWGISGVCSQYLFMEYDMNSAWLTAIRMVFSGIILLIIAMPKEKKRTFKIWTVRKDVLWLLTFALLGLLMCQYTFLGAIKYSNSATATVLQSLNVVIMAVAMAIWTKTRMRISQSAAIFLAVLGTYLIAAGGDPDSMTLSGAGLVFGILSAIGVVTYTLLSRSIIATWGNLLVTGWGMLIGGAVIFITTKAWIVPSNLDLTGWLMITIIVLIGTAASFSAFLEGVKYIGPVKATLIGCMEPAAATALSAIFLGTKFSLFELIGFCCIVLTVFLSVKENPAGRKIRNFSQQSGRND